VCVPPFTPACVSLLSHKFDAPQVLAHLLPEIFLDSLRDLTIELEGWSGQIDEAPGWMDSMQEVPVGLSLRRAQVENVQVPFLNITYLERFLPFVDLLGSIATQATFRVVVAY
jgi:hypothetical protein